MVLLLWIICVIYVLCLSCFRVYSLLPFVHLMGNGWPVALVCDVQLFLSLSHVVSWVRCGAWLYRFLIFAAFLTFIIVAYDISSTKVTYTFYTFNFCLLFIKYSINAGWWLMEDWKELVFLKKNRLLSIYTSIVRCVYNLKIHTFFSVICGVSFFICAMCIVYVCSVLICSIITTFENVSYIFLNNFSV